MNTLVYKIHLLLIVSCSLILQTTVQGSEKNSTTTVWASGSLDLAFDITKPTLIKHDEEPYEHIRIVLHRVNEEDEYDTGNTLGHSILKYYTKTKCGELYKIFIEPRYRSNKLGVLLLHNHYS